MLHDTDIPKVIIARGYTDTRIHGHADNIRHESNILGRFSKNRIIFWEKKSMDKFNVRRLLSEHIQYLLFILIFIESPVEFTTPDHFTIIFTAL